MDYAPGRARHSKYFIFHLAQAAFSSGSNQSNTARRAGSIAQNILRLLSEPECVQMNGDSMDTKYEDANLILKLYELRREEVMRKARDWFIMQFNPGSMQDFTEVMMSDKGAYFRMVTSYWDMAASLVNHGAIDEQMFTDANGEYMIVYAKIEPFLAEMRTGMGSPQYLLNLEKLIMRKPDAKESLTAMRERMKQWAAMRAEAASKAQAG